MFILRATVTKAEPKSLPATLAVLLVVGTGTGADFPIGTLGTTSWQMRGGNSHFCMTPAGGKLSEGTTTDGIDVAAGAVGRSASKTAD
jgi:hypothetical protein